MLFENPVNIGFITFLKRPFELIYCINKNLNRIHKVFDDFTINP